MKYVQVSPWVIGVMIHCGFQVMSVMLKSKTILKMTLKIMIMIAIANFSM